MLSVGGVPARPVEEIEPLVLRRGEDFLVFRFRGLANLDEFNALVPDPDPKQFGYMTPQGWKHNPKDSAYLDQVKRKTELRWLYTILVTLEPSDIQWSEVRRDQPDSWRKIEPELRQILSWQEINRLIEKVEEANVLSPEALEANLQSFLQRQAEISANSAASDCPSGAAKST